MVGGCYNVTHFLFHGNTNSSVEIRLVKYVYISANVRTTTLKGRNMYLQSSRCEESDGE